MNAVEMYGEKFFRVYGKYPGAKRFAPMDLKAGCCVGNLIYATFFVSKERADAAVAEATRLNPEWSFETRKV